MAETRPRKRTYQSVAEVLTALAWAMKTWPEQDINESASTFILRGWCIVDHLHRGYRLRVCKEGEKSYLLVFSDDSYACFDAYFRANIESFLEAGGPEQDEPFQSVGCELRLTLAALDACVTYAKHLGCDQETAVSRLLYLGYDWTKMMDTGARVELQMKKGTRWQLLPFPAQL